MSIGGVSDQAKRQTSLERYGVENAMQTPEALEKRKETCLERYGVESVFQVPEVLEKRRTTYTANWGVDHPMKSEEGRRQHSNAMLSRSEQDREVQRVKTRQTCLRRFGVEHPMFDPNSAYRQKRDKTCLERYSSAVPTKSEQVKSKTRATNIGRYGTPFPMMNEDVKARMVESLKQNDLQAIAIKRFETMKRNGSFRKSRAEDKMYELLARYFGTDDVERNKRPEGTAWPIDFYVKSIDAWIQVDGIYWHGLDGQLEEHRKRASHDRRSRIIVYKWETDRRQNAWFAERELRLFRFTDIQIRSFPNEFDIRNVLLTS
jgi:hypothetical protein